MRRGQALGGLPEGGWRLDRRGRRVFNHVVCSARRPGQSYRETYELEPEAIPAAARVAAGFGMTLPEPFAADLANEYAAETHSWLADRLTQPERIADVAGSTSSVLMSRR